MEVKELAGEDVSEGGEGSSAEVMAAVSELEVGGEGWLTGSVRGGERGPVGGWLAGLTGGVTTDWQYCCSTSLATVYILMVLRAATILLHEACGSL